MSGTIFLRRGRLLVYVALAAIACTVVPEANGVEIQGRIVSVDDKTITAETAGSQLPVAGDNFRVVVAVPGTEILAEVGEGAVTKVDETTVWGQIATATGRVAVDQIVVFDSANPMSKPVSKPVPKEEIPKAEKKDDGSASDAGEPTDSADESATGSPAGSRDSNPKDTTANDNAEDRSDRSVLERLQGEWLCIETLEDGEPSQRYLGVRAVIEKDRLTWKFPEEDGSMRRQEAAFRLKPDVAPVHFDWWNLEARENVEQRLVEFTDRDQFRWASNAGRQRPTSFDAARFVFVMAKIESSSDAADAAGDEVAMDRRDEPDSPASDAEKAARLYRDALALSEIDELIANQQMLAAAELGHVQAMVRISEQYADGRGVQRDSKAALRWLQSAADGGNAEAIYQLGRRYEKGQGVEQDLVLSAELFLRAANQRHANAQAAIAYAYEMGRGVDVDMDEARRWVKLGAENGSVRAMNNIAALLEAGGEYDTAVFWYREAAADGSARAAANLGRLYRDAIGVERDYAASVSWLRKAVEQDDPVGQLHLAYAYAFGWGVTKDMKAGRDWFLKSARQGNSEAQFKYGLMIYNGWAVKKNYKTSFGWMKLAAKNGNADAMNTLGNMYTEGHGVTRNYATAVDWYEKAITAGSKEGPYNLGQRYLQGQGVPLDSKRARELFFEAAQRGNPQGHFMYAWSLERMKDRGSLSESKWRELIIHHFRKADELGETKAREALRSYGVQP